MNTAALLLASLAVAAQPARAPAAASPDSTTLSHCVISLIDHVELPAEEEGLLSELIAKEGMIVTKGQVLGQVDQTDALVRLKASQYRVDVANEKATNDAQIQVARKLIELSKAEYEESLAINRRSSDTIPETQLRRQRVTWEKAVLDALAADMEFKIAKLEHKEAEAQVEAVNNELMRRQIKAPFDGVVVTLYRQQNEWVKPGDPIIRVVRMDRLRVETFLNANQFAPDEIAGAEVEIRLTLAGGEQRVLPAKIDYVSPIVEASGSFRVWAEVDNPPGRGGYPWLMRSGAEADMVIKLNRPGVAVTRSR